MSTQPIYARSRNRGFGPERAMRRGAARRRAAAAPAAASPSVPIAPQAGPSLGGGARVLRRWSVAELIARAVAGTRLVA